MKQNKKILFQFMFGILFLPSVELSIPQYYLTLSRSQPTTKTVVDTDVEISERLPLYQLTSPDDAKIGSKHPDFENKEPAPTPTTALSHTNQENTHTNVAPATPEHLEGWFETYAKAFGVEKRKLKAIAHCESHFNPGAVNGPYGGMFQYSASTWRSTRNSMGLDPDPSLRFDAEQSIHTTAFKIAHGGIGAWPVCGTR